MRCYRQRMKNSFPAFAARKRGGDAGVVCEENQNGSRGINMDKIAAKTERKRNGADNVILAEAYPELQTLTKRERELFWLLLEGYETQKLCEALGLARNTVCAYISGLYRKCGTYSRSSLRAKYRQLYYQRRAYCP